MEKIKSISSKKLLRLTLESLEHDKGIDIISIDLIGRSSIADYMVIVSGNTVRQVLAIANNLVKKYKEIGIWAPSPEGMSNGDWVLIDAKDVLVHIFRPEVRDFYSLEKMWQKKQDDASENIVKNKT